MKRTIGSMRGFIVRDVGEIADVSARGGKSFRLREKERVRTKNISSKTRTNLSHRSEETTRGPCVAAAEVLDELMPSIHFDGRWPYEVHAVSGRRAANDFTRRPGDLTRIEHVLRLGLVHPIHVGFGQYTIEVRKTRSI